MWLVVDAYLHFYPFVCVLSFSEPKANFKKSTGQHIYLVSLELSAVVPALICSNYFL